MLVDESSLSSTSSDLTLSESDEEQKETEVLPTTRAGRKTRRSVCGGTTNTDKHALLSLSLHFLNYYLCVYVCGCLSYFYLFFKAVTLEVGLRMLF